MPHKIHPCIVASEARDIRFGSILLKKCQAQAHCKTVLARLEREPDISENELAAITELAPMTVARLVDRLEKLDLVKCCADPKVVVLFAFSFPKVTVIVEISKDGVRPRRFEQRKQPSQQDVNQTGGVPHIEIEGIK